MAVIKKSPWRTRVCLTSKLPLYREAVAVAIGYDDMKAYCSNMSDQKLLNVFWVFFFDDFAAYNASDFRIYFMYYRINVFCDCLFIQIYLDQIDIFINSPDPTSTAPSAAA